MAPSRGQIVQAYRRLYLHGLRAVQYSKPGRYTLRDRLRRVFRKGDPEDFDQGRIDKTIEFLEGATIYKGVEHRIVKNLLRVWWWQNFHLRTPQYRPQEQKSIKEVQATSFDHFDHTIQMLNKTMGTCL